VSWFSGNWSDRRVEMSTRVAVEGVCGSTSIVRDRPTSVKT